MKHGAVMLLAGVLEGLLRLVGGCHGYQGVIFAAAWAVHDLLLVFDLLLFLLDLLRLGRFI